MRLCKIYNEDSEPLKAETSAKLVLTNLPARGANTEMNNLIFEARLQLARSLYLQRNEKQALARYQECLKAAEGTGNVFLLEESLKGIATIYESSNEFQSTEKLFVRLMNTSADPLKHAAYTFMLAKLYLQQNRPLEAQGGVALLRECLSIRQHLLPPRDSAVRETFRLLILGEVCRRTRAIQVNPELDGLARQYVAITERTPSAGPDERAEALSMMACVVYRNGGFDQSKACIEKLLLIAKHHHTVTDAFGQWFYDTAKEVYPESLARVQSIFEERVRSAHEPANSIAYAQFLDDVARVARERGDHKTALKNQSLAKDIVLKHPPDTLWATDRWRGAMIIGNYARSVALGEASKYYALEKQYRSEE